MTLKTKVYYHDSEIYNILWERYISWFDKNTISKFSDRLQNYIIYIKKENPKLLSNIYQQIYNKENIDLDTKQNKIIKLIKKTETNKDDQWLFELYDIFTSIWIEKASINDFNINDVLFNILTSKSRKKLLWYKLKQKYPQKEWENFKDYKCRLKKIINDLAWIYKDDSDVIWDMFNMWIDWLFYRIAMEFWNDSSDAIQNIIRNWWIDEDNIELITNYLKEWWVNDKYIKKLKEAFFLLEDVKPTLTKQSEEKIKWKNEKALENIEISNRKIIADFNPFLLELWFETAIKTLWYNRFLEVYEKVFFNIAKQILDKTNSNLPTFNKFLKFDVKKLEWKKEESEKKSFTFQFIIEFNVNKDFNLKNLKDIAILLNEEIWDINLVSPEIWESFKHPLSTIDSKNLKYDGYFSDSGEHFSDDNILLIKWENWEKKLRLTLANFAQDEYIYLISQIWYYISHWNFIDKHQLYFNIYDKYNKTLFNEKLFDIKVLKENYEQFVRNIILPLSKEWLNIWLKPSNILLAWPYGTSKSQFLKHMLLDKKWNFNNKEFFLNANVIPLGLQEFKTLLLQWIGGIKTRLDQIFQRTSTPIVLLIEDLDTLVNEKSMWVNDEIAQAMTLFFEWLGSLPVNVITTSNDPTKFSERLIRPNRLSKILIFNRPTIEEKKKMIKEHLKFKWLKLNKEQLENIYKTNVFKEGTASHIGEIVKELDNYIKIEKEIFNKKLVLTDEIINKIIWNITISTKDLSEQEENISNWYKEVSWTIKNHEMWFMSN